MKNEHDQNLTGWLGEEFGTGLRQTSGYEQTQKEIRRDGITNHSLNQTPPVGLNLELLSKLPSITKISKEFAGREVQSSMFGLAIPEGADDFQRFVEFTLHASRSDLTVVEIDEAMVRAVSELRRPQVTVLLADARHSSLDSTSQDINIRDHLGNCCPPDIDRQIDEEVARTLKFGGIAIVNITTSELLKQSLHRKVISFTELSELLPETVILALKNSIYDLSQLKSEFGDELEVLRSHILEIEPNGSFVVFGEDADGHGEWYRSFEDHLDLWKSHGFEVIDMLEREGDDSHIPPLRCLRHHVVLRKAMQ